MTESTSKITQLPPRLSLEERIEELKRRGFGALKDDPQLMQQCEEIYRKRDEEKAAEFPDESV